MSSSALVANGCSGHCQDRARELSVNLHFEHEFEADLGGYSDYDLVIAADGVNSKWRDAYAEHLGIDIQVRANKFVWLGTTKVFDASALRIYEGASEVQRMIITRQHLANSG